jgi:hypothetical protein
MTREIDSWYELLVRFEDTISGLTRDRLLPANGLHTGRRNCGEAKRVLDKLADGGDEAAAVTVALEK